MSPNEASILSLIAESVAAGESFEAEDFEISRADLHKRLTGDSETIGRILETKRDERFRFERPDLVQTAEEIESWVADT